MLKLLSGKLSLKRTIIIAFFGGVFTFLYLTGTIYSGYHLIDDHKMLEIHRDLTSNNYLDVIYSYFRSDLVIRFRPLFYPYIISLVKLFGINFTLLSIAVGFIFFITLSAFFLAMKSILNSARYAILFVLLVFMGPQMAIWWRLGTNETIAVFFLGASFYFIAKCLENKNYKLYNFLFIISLMMSSLSKESFIVIIPAVILLKIVSEKKTFKASFLKSMKKNRLSIFPIIIVLVELLLIACVVGTNSIDYAGIPESTREITVGFRQILFSVNSILPWLGLIFILLILYLISMLIDRRRRQQGLIKLDHPLILYTSISFLIIIPEVLMHLKSGMTERYLLPTTLGFAILIIGILQQIRHKIIKTIAFAAVFIFLTVLFVDSVKDAVKFADNGHQTNKMLTAIRENINSETTVLLVADPVNRYEVSYSIKSYLSFHGFNNLYAYPITKQPSSTFEANLNKKWQELFEKKHFKTLVESPDIILIYDGEHKEKFFHESKVPNNYYVNILDASNPSKIYKKNELEKN